MVGHCTTLGGTMHTFVIVGLYCGKFPADGSKVSGGRDPVLAGLGAGRILYLPINQVFNHLNITYSRPSLFLAFILKDD